MPPVNSHSSPNKISKDSKHNWSLLLPTLQEMNEYALRYLHKEYWYGLNSFFLPRSHDRSLQNGHNTPPKAYVSLQLLQTRPILRQFRHNFCRILHAIGVAESWKRFLASTSTRHRQGSTPSIAWFWRDATPPPGHGTTTFFPLLSIPTVSFHIQRSRSLDFPHRRPELTLSFKEDILVFLNGRMRLAVYLIGRFLGRLYPANGEATPVGTSSTYGHCFSRGPVGFYSFVKASL